MSFFIHVLSVLALTKNDFDNIDFMMSNRIENVNHVINTNSTFDAKLKIVIAGMQFMYELQKNISDDSEPNINGNVLKYFSKTQVTEKDFLNELRLTEWLCVSHYDDTYNKAVYGELQVSSDVMNNLELPKKCKLDMRGRLLFNDFVYIPACDKIFDGKVEMMDRYQKDNFSELKQILPVIRDIKCDSETFLKTFEIIDTKYTTFMRHDKIVQISNSKVIDTLCLSNLGQFSSLCKLRLECGVNVFTQNLCNAINTNTNLYELSIHSEHRFGGLFYDWLKNNTTIQKLYIKAPYDSKICDVIKCNTTIVNFRYSNSIINMNHIELFEALNENTTLSQIELPRFTSISLNVDQILMYVKNHYNNIPVFGGQYFTLRLLDDVKIIFNELVTLYHNMPNLYYMFSDVTCMYTYRDKTIENTIKMYRKNNKKYNMSLSALCVLKN